MNPDRQALLARVERLADQLDSAFPIPGTSLRFGWESIIGLIPTVGDLVMGGVSLYIVGTAWRLGVPRQELALMVGNVLLDVAIGAIPLVGDVFDLFFKVNRRNVALIRESLSR